MMHVKFDTFKLMDKLWALEERVGSFDVDAAVAQALDDVAEYLLGEMQKAVKRHYRTGNAYKAIKRTEVQRAGNYQWVEVGAMYIRAEDQDGFHVVYLEYGSPTLAADPWLRPAMEKRAQINRIITEAFKKRGVPNVKAA